MLYPSWRPGSILHFLLCVLLDMFLRFQSNYSSSVTVVHPSMRRGLQSHRGKRSQQLRRRVQQQWGSCSLSRCGLCETIQLIPDQGLHHYASYVLTVELQSDTQEDGIEPNPTSSWAVLLQTKHNTGLTLSEAGLKPRVVDVLLCAIEPYPILLKWSARCYCCGRFQLNTRRTC